MASITGTNVIQAARACASAPVPRSRMLRQSVPSAHAHWPRWHLRRPATVLKICRSSPASTSEPSVRNQGVRFSACAAAVLDGPNVEVACEHSNVSRSMVTPVR